MNALLPHRKILPRLLVIDDLFGRNVPGGRNVDRENLCAHFLLEDVTEDLAARSSKQKVHDPLAQAVFFRGQTPVAAEVGDVVENDLGGTLALIRAGWLPATENFQSAGHSGWSLILLDLSFYTGQVTTQSHQRTPGMPVGRPADHDAHNYFGLVMLDAIRREFPELPVLILSGKPREEVSLEFIRRGAVGFIARDDLRGPELLGEALQLHGLLPDPSGRIIGQARPLLLALREARRAAMHRENVLILGERGVGKELVARYLHGSSSLGHFSSGSTPTPFVTVNSAVFTQELFASELFGIEPRTATGVEGKTGLIEAAQGGNLFLDEVADMPDVVQAAILRVLQERQFTRVGGKRPEEANVRFIAATNIDIDNPDLGFRADLLDRLRLGGTITLPPLRERLEDLPYLVEYFVREAEARNRGARPRQVSQDSLELLREHRWPGNIRELRSVVFDAVNRFPDVEYLVATHLRLKLTGAEAVPPSGDSRGATVSVSGREIDGGRVPQRFDLDELLSAIEEFSFKSDAANGWAGRLTDVQQACAWLMARHLEASLAATKRRTPDAPEGQIQVHPAVKLLTGDRRITASKAADLIKRLLAPLADELDGDLRSAYETALRLRPKSTVISGLTGRPNARS